MAARRLRQPQDATTEQFGFGLKPVGLRVRPSSGSCQRDLVGPLPDLVLAWLAVVDAQACCGRGHREQPSVHQPRPRRVFVTRHVPPSCASQCDFSSVARSGPNRGGELPVTPSAAKRGPSRSLSDTHCVRRPAGEHTAAWVRPDRQRHPHPTDLRPHPSCSCVCTTVTQDATMARNTAGGRSPGTTPAQFVALANGHAVASRDAQPHSRGGSFQATATQHGRAGVVNHPEIASERGARPLRAFAGIGGHRLETRPFRSFSQYSSRRTRAACCSRSESKTRSMMLFHFRVLLVQSQRSRFLAHLLQ